jgi:hypothetical protein
MVAPVAPAVAPEGLQAADPLPVDLRVVVVAQALAGLPWANGGLSHGRQSLHP